MSDNHRIPPLRGLPDVETMVMTAVDILREAGRTAGLSGQELEDAVAHTLAFARRRITGDYDIDDYGFDEDLVAHAYLPALRLLYRSWFRVEVRGIENLPPAGEGALVVSNHSGTIAIDAVMTQVAVHDEHPDGRYLRMLGADILFDTPWLGEWARKAGATLASPADAEQLLADGHLVGVWPEGFKGVGKLFDERYRLQRFGRGGYVASAVRSQVPIVPCSVVGAEEAYPMLADIAPLARLLGLPYFPVTPTFPHLGLLGLIPLPTKWIIEFSEPIDATQWEPDDAEDARVVFDLSDQVRDTIQETLYRLVEERGSAFR